MTSMFQFETTSVFLYMSEKTSEMLKYYDYLISTNFFISYYVTYYVMQSFKTRQGF